jgi:hypothetical protein
MKIKIKLLTTVMAFAALVLSSSTVHAIGNSQTQFDTNRLTFATTNYYNIPSDVNTNPATTLNASTNQTVSPQYIDTGKATDAWIEAGGFFTNSTANSSNITFRIAATLDFANWTNNYTSLVLIVPGSSTNFCSTGPVKLASPPPGLTLRSAENANTAVIGAGTNSVFFRVVQKTGI